MCFDALKKGWLEGCRRIIGFDGCFLKGACKGELLVAVGKNGNQQMFRITWAVVDKETKHSWSFFINYLKDDLQLGTGEGLTVMAYMQKGFIAALNEVLPNAKFRMCARHIYSNWHKKWKGRKGENSFGASRHKSIITMLEEIRRKIMTRQVDMLKFANTWISDISPMERLLLEDSKELARKCTVLWNVDVGFEIGEGLHKHVVNLTDKVCTCRAWQLRGIPCQHVVLAYYRINKEPEQAVEHWYKRDTFLKAYKYFIQPMTNMKMWTETDNPKIEPPKTKPMPGRPQRNRRKGKDEPKKKYGKLSKCGVKMTCSKCHQQGHNKRYCKAENWMPSQQGSQTSQGASQPDAVGSSSQPTNSVCFDTTRPGTSSQRVIASGLTYKSAAPTGIDLGFKARGLRSCILQQFQNSAAIYYNSSFKIQKFITKFSCTEVYSNNS
ncbi:PREDICTED: uncharacterized protein LOC109215211 [Nicotiana attenuata]|uniref:uncharacterized protein LOC109215211 n=1 Tax=Nicotiana attenuata TaxID=49451 RepID=UPI000904EE81|nr:PREDICTED: uncharacterized protein LOC109215211 [Nicotiana attenuata]